MKERVRRRDLLAFAAALPVLSAANALAQKHGRTSSGSSGEAAASVLPAGNATVNVRDLGATGDGATKDTVALQLALDRCSVLGGGEVVVPPGNYVTGTLRVHSRTTLRIEQGATLLGSADPADYPFTQVRWEGRWIKGRSALITAQDAEQIHLTGPGRIVASPDIKGRYTNADGSPFVFKRSEVNTFARGQNATAREDILRNPALLEFVHCRNLAVDNLDTHGNDMWSTHPVYCEHVIFRNVNVVSGADGIDVDSCRDVVIDNCTFDTRDDCISLKSGRGMEGNRIGAVCEDVTITNCKFKDAVWACIGVGSETSGGIRRVTVAHCHCLGARTFAIYIKSRVGRGAFLEDFTFRDIDASNCGQGFLRFNILNSGLQDPEPVPGMDGIPTIRNWSFSDIRVTDVPVLVDGSAISPEKPLDGFTFRNVTGTCGKGIELANIHHADLQNIHVTGFAGPMLATRNVSGVGLKSAAPLPEKTSAR